MWFEQPAEQPVESLRLAEALAVQPDVVAVACPFCLTMLASAASSQALAGAEILDIAEVVARALDARDEVAGAADSL